MRLLCDALITSVTTISDKKLTIDPWKVKCQNKTDQLCKLI